MSQPIHPMLERVAKQIARANGDEFANAFANKSRWVAKRGMSGGRYRDVNEPYQQDYIDMARAAIQALMEPDEGISGMPVAIGDEYTVGAHRYRVVSLPVLEEQR